MATKDITDRQVCEAFAAYHAHGVPFADERLRQSTGQPDKVLLRAMERACGRNFVEYGVSLRSGWLTGSGKALLAAGVFVDHGLSTTRVVDRETPNVRRNADGVTGAPESQRVPTLEEMRDLLNGTPCEPHGLVACARCAAEESSNG